MYRLELSYMRSVFPAFKAPLCCILVILSATITAADFSAKHQNQINSDQTDLPNKFLLVQLWDDLQYLTNQPDFYLTLGLIAGSPQLFSNSFKTESAEFTEQWSASPFADKLFEMGETAGNSAVPFGFSVFSYTTGKLFHSNKMVSFGSDLFRSQAMNGLFTIALKVAIDRKRPDGTPYSYPSGHTSSAFATAGTIQSHFGYKLGLPAFALAGYVGFSRLQEGKHYLSDVIAGGLLGYYVSTKLSRRKKGSGGISLSPFRNKTGTGLSLSLKF